MITNATRQDLQFALDCVNERYAGNVAFENISEKGKRLQFTLCVKDSTAPGHRRGMTGRRMPKACWHVHGHFFEELIRSNADNYVISRGGKSGRIDRNGGNWQDMNIGSVLRPLYLSEACDCE